MDFLHMMWAIQLGGNCTTWRRNLDGKLSTRTCMPQDSSGEYSSRAPFPGYLITEAVLRSPDGGRGSQPIPSSIFWALPQLWATPPHPVYPSFPSLIMCLSWVRCLQFSSVQSLSRVRLFATPWIAACQASLSITKSRSLLKLMSLESVMPPSHLILCCPPLLLPPIPPSVRVFSNELGALARHIISKTEGCMEVKFSVGGCGL